MSNPNMDEQGRVWKWAIEPHPYDSQFDTMVTDDDQEAKKAILYAAEAILWDQNDGDETKKLKVTHRPDFVTANALLYRTLKRYG